MEEQAVESGGTDTSEYPPAHCYQRRRFHSAVCPGLPCKTKEALSLGTRIPAGTELLSRRTQRAFRWMPGSSVTAAFFF